MSMNLAAWWPSVMTAGAPLFPYVGVALLIIVGVGVLWLCAYLLLRLSKRAPPALRYLSWRVATFVKRLGQRRAKMPGRRLRVGFADGRPPVFLHELLGAATPVPWRRPARSEASAPLFVMLGPSAAGKSSVLHARAPGGHTGPEAEHLPMWWDVDEARVLELPASFWAHGLQGRFSELLALLKRAHACHRLDGVVLSLRPAHLLGDAEQAKELALLAEAVNQLGMASGQRIPLDVVLCGIEEVAGFAEFAPLAQGRAQAKDLHWVHRELQPPSDLQVCFAQWASQARAAALTIVATSAPDGEFGSRNGALKFPAQLEALAAPLAKVVGVICRRAQARQSTPVLRSVLLAGLTAGRSRASQPEARPALRLALLDSAPQGLPFRMDPRATPTAQFIKQRRMRVARAAAALVASALLLGWWLPASLERLRVDVLAVDEALLRHRADISARQALPGDRPSEPARAQAPRLLDAISVVSNASPFALLAPSSWFDRVRTRALVLLGGALQAGQIEPRLRALQDESAPPAMAWALSAAPSPVQGFHAERVGELPAYAALGDVLRQIEDRLDAVEAAAQLPRSATYLQLSRFLGIDAASLDQWRIDRHARLPSAVVRQFDLSIVQHELAVNEPARQAVVSLREELLTQALDAHPIVVLSEQSAELLGRLARQQSFSAQDAQDLAERLRRLQREFDQPSARRVLGKLPDALGFFGEPLARLGASRAGLMDEVAATSTSIAQHRDAVRRRLLSYEVNGVDRMFVLQPVDGSLAWSPEMKRFVASYAALMTQPFMHQRGAVEVRAVPPAGPLKWNLAQLSQARDLAAAQREFAASGVQAFEPLWRASLLRLAQNQASTAIEAVFLRAAASLPTPEIGPGSVDPVGALRPHVVNLVAAARIYRQAALSEARTTPGVAGEALIGELINALSRLDRLLKAEDPYAPLLADIRHWLQAGGERSLAAAMRGPVKDRLTLARDYVRVQYAELAGQMLEALHDLSPDSARTATVQSWRWMVETLDGFDKGVPGNGLAELEQHVLNLSKMKGPDDCAGFLSERPAGAWRSDYFSTRGAALDEVVFGACAQRKQETQRRAYAELASWFNAQVAGRAPFGAQAAQAPLSRRAFEAVLRRYDEWRQRLPGAHEQWPASVVNFLARMDELVARFSPAQRPERAAADKPSTDRTPSAAGDVVRARLALRSERSAAVLSEHIIDATVMSGERAYGLRNAGDPFEWHIGEPIEVRLRWAAQSPFQPVAAQDDARYAVLDRTATFRLGGEWALFDLLRQYSVRGDAYEQAVVRLPVDVVGPEGRRTAQFYMTFASVTPQASLGLDFPQRAPALQGTLAAIEERNP